MLRFEDCLPTRNALLWVALPVRSLALSLRLQTVMALRLKNRNQMALYALSLELSW